MLDLLITVFMIKWEKNDHTKYTFLIGSLYNFTEWTSWNLDRDGVNSFTKQRSMLWIKVRKNDALSDMTYSCHYTYKNWSNFLLRRFVWAITKLIWSLNSFTWCFLIPKFERNNYHHSHFRSEISHTIAHRVSCSWMN